MFKFPFFGKTEVAEAAIAVAPTVSKWVPVIKYAKVIMSTATVAALVIEAHRGRQLSADAYAALDKFDDRIAEVEKSHGETISKINQIAELAHQSVSHAESAATAAAATLQVTERIINDTNKRLEALKQTINDSETAIELINTSLQDHDNQLGEVKNLIAQFQIPVSAKSQRTSVAPSL